MASAPLPCSGHWNNCQDSKYRRALRTSEEACTPAVLIKPKRHLESKQATCGQRRERCVSALCAGICPECVLTTHYAPGTAISQGRLHEPDSHLVTSQSLALVSGVRGSGIHPEC